MWTFNDQSIVKKNHMDILWHKYADKSEEKTIVDADLPAKASVVGRVGLMMLSCGTGAWRVRSSMNELSALLDMTCTVDIGLMSINYTCFDGNDAFSQSLCLTNTGVNTSKLNRLEKFVMLLPVQELAIISGVSFRNIIIRCFCALLCQYQQHVFLILLC